jgi:amidase
MAVLRPTQSQIRRLGEKLGLNLSDRETELFAHMMEGFCQAYDVVDELPNHLPEVRYPRTSGYRPYGEENKFNAWARKVRINGAPSGLLAGKRVVLKDSICLAGVPMTVGAGFMQAYVPEVDATVVTRILDAGGEIVGKAACEYLCSSGSSNTSWPLPVLNPHDTACSAGGSSSGSAVLIAVGDADMSLGGDQGGSIRIPAAWCGIVGLKPTYGLIPYTGMAPIEWTVDHTGPMTANVEDNALLLEVVAGSDGIDTRHAAPVTANYREIMRMGIRGLRIGVIKESLGTPESDAEVDAKILAAAGHFERLGAKVETVSVPVHAIGRAIWTPTIVEGSMDFMMRWNGAGTNHGGLFVPGAAEAMSRWRERADEISVPLKVLMLAAEFMSTTYSGHFYGKSQNLMRWMRDEYDAALKRYELLIMPTTPQTPTRLPREGASIDEVWGSALNMNRNTAPFCGTGHPAISIPCGLINNLPVGLMLIGKHWDEGTIYRAAYAFSQEVEWRKV